MASDALRVCANLASELAGDPPHLDALLVYVSSRLHGKSVDAEPGYKVDRQYPCPETHHIPIAMPRVCVAGHQVALCTSPMLPEPTSDRHEYICKRVGVEHAELLAVGERRVVTTTNGWTKSHRLPLRVRRVSCVVWLCVGNRREIRSLLRYVPAIGKKISDGYGRVERWEVDRLDFAPLRYWPWWIASDVGPVLMRPLPAAWSGLPKNLIGAKADYGACADPYWHPDRAGEVVTPC